MQAVLAYRWLMYGFPANFCVHVSHHKDVPTIARKSLWGINLFHLVSWITSSLIVIRRPLGLYSDRTFQVANRMVFIVLICPIFSYFSLVISVFSVDGEWRRRATYWWSLFRHPVIPLQSANPLGSDAVCGRFSWDQTLLFPSPSLSPNGLVTTNFTQKQSVTKGCHEEAEGRSLMRRGYMLRLPHHVWHTELISLTLP
jgi:hypothetical protein